MTNPLSNEIFNNRHHLEVDGKHFPHFISRSITYKTSVPRTPPCRLYSQFEAIRILLEPNISLAAINARVARTSHTLENGANKKNMGKRKLHGTRNDECLYRKIANSKKKLLNRYAITDTVFNTNINMPQKEEEERKIVQSYHFRILFLDVALDI